MSGKRGYYRGGDEGGASLRKGQLNRHPDEVGEQTLRSSRGSLKVGGQCVWF